MAEIRETSSTGLKWQRVKKYILAEVAAHKYLPGDSLPSESVLCERSALLVIQFVRLSMNLKATASFIESRAKVHFFPNQTIQKIRHGSKCSG
jgi:hypothetical protein